MKRSLECTDYELECVLLAGSCDGKHVFKLNDGSYIAWKDDFECDCCEPEDSDRCYIYGEISEAEYKKIAGIE